MFTDARVPRFSSQQIKNIRKLRTLVELAETKSPTQCSRSPLIARVRKLGFDIPRADYLPLAQPEEEIESLSESSLQDKPVEVMIAALQCSERAIRKGLQHPSLPRGRVINHEDHAQRKCNRAKAVNDQDHKLRCRTTSAEEEIWAPEELRHIIRQHLDCRMRVFEMASAMASSETPKPAKKVVFQLPYSHPGLSNWKEGVLTDLADRVIVIREISVQQQGTQVNSSSTFSLQSRFPSRPLTCSSRIPLKNSLREMLQDYVSLRVFRPGERKLALTYETYLNGQPEKPATPALITHGPNRSTIREVVRALAWHDARHGLAGWSSLLCRPAAAGLALAA